MSSQQLSSSAAHPERTQMSDCGQRVGRNLLDRHSSQKVAAEVFNPRHGPLTEVAFTSACIRRFIAVHANPADAVDRSARLRVIVPCYNEPATLIASRRSTDER